MQNQQVLDIISNLKGRRNYEEKKSKKLGYNSLYENVVCALCAPKNHPDGIGP